MGSKVKIVLLILLGIAALSTYYLAKRFILLKEEIKEVEATEVKRGKIKSVVEAEGKIGCSLIRTICAKEDGIVRLLKVKEGDKVEAGNLLCIILNPSLFEDKPEIEKALAKSQSPFLIDYLQKKYHKIVEPLESARLKLIQLEENYQQYEILYSKKAISLQELKERKALYSQARFQYLSAKKEIEKRIGQAQVKTPISGRIVRIFCEEGTEVKIGQELFVVANMKLAQAELLVDELQIERVKKGQPVEIVAETLASPLVGEVKSIGVYAQSSNMGTAKVPVICSINLPEGVMPILGSSIKGSIIVKSKEDALICPRLALLATSSRNAVWTINGSRAILRPVTIGIEGEEMVEIMEGLKEGEMIIVGGILSIKEGDLVRAK